MMLSVIIPAYNEEKRIGNTLSSYSSYFENLRKNKILDYEFIVVINNTVDKTEEIVKSAQKKNPRIKFLNLKPGGKGFAVVQGFREAFKGDSQFIGFVDADMATSPEEYAKIFFSIKNFDGVIASRYVNGSVIEPKPTIQRKIAKWAFNSVVRAFLFLPYRDTQCGAKIFRMKVIEEIIDDLSMSQWAFDVELLYKIRKKGFLIKEIPTKWHDKEYSKINFWCAGPGMVLGVLRLRLLNSPFKTLMRIYDKLIRYVPR